MRQILSQHIQPSRSLWIRIAIAVILIAVSALTNRQFLGWGLFVVFAVLAVPLGRARSFLYSFVPYAVVWFVFTALRSLADETVLARTLNTHVSRLERWLFGGQLPSITLQDRFLDLSNLSWYDYFLTGVHWSYFIIPHAVAIRTWQKHPALFRHYLGAMMLLLAVGLCIYFLIPSNPPWLAPEPINSPSAAPVFRVMEAIGKELGGGLYQASYRVIGESNAIAAMPSIHMAITFLLVFPARRAGRRWTILAFIYS
ncbi:MAG: phosphatase PAP2 family protein, partial [Thermomicrobiales bacterium]